MRKAISIIFVLAVVLCLFAGCGNDNDDAASVQSSVQSEGFVISTADVTFINSDGESVYRIIRPAEGVLDEATSAAIVFKQMKSDLGISIKNVSDEADGTDAYEILIGNTNRPESQQALDYLKSKTDGRYDDYIICTVGKKIVINAFNAESLNTAVKYFADEFIKTEGIKGGIEYLFAAQGNFETITVNGTNISKFNLVKPQYNTSYLTQLELEKLQEKVYQKTGFRPQIVRENDANTEYEIIVGNSTRDGVETVDDHDMFSIKFSDKKVYLNGGSAHSTAMSVSEFSKMLDSGVVNGTDISGSYNGTIAKYDQTTTLCLVWGDEFDGDTLNTEKWKQENESNTAVGVNGKTSVRSSDPNDVYLKDGKFYICARQDENYYYGGMINTGNRMCFRYGYTEVSAVVPHGDGFWVAFWANNAGLMSDRIDPDVAPFYTPEIDIMEMFGNSATYAANMHYWPTSYGKQNGLEHKSLDGTTHGNAKKYHCPDGKKLNDDFHTYGLVWDDKHMGFTCDGIEYFSYDTTQDFYDIECFNRHITLTFSMATGFETSVDSKISTNPDEWQNSNKLIADYINVYQYNDGKSTIYTGQYK